MRWRAKLVIISGALLSSASLLIHAYLLDQRTAINIDAQSTHVVLQLCDALQGLERFFARRSAAAGSAYSDEDLQDLASHSLQLASASGLPRRLVRAGPPPSGPSRPKEPSLVCARPLAATPMAMAVAAPSDEAIDFTSGRDQGDATQWIRLSAQKLPAADQQADWRLTITPWSLITTNNVGAGQPYHLAFGDLHVGLQLLPADRAQNGHQRTLALTLGLLGVLVSVLMAYLAGRRASQNQHVIGAFRKDGRTSFLTHYALVKDLEVPDQNSHTQRQHEAALLVTINFRYLERLIGFHSELETTEILTKACRAIDKGWPVHTGFDFYHIAKHKIALIFRASGTIPIADTTTCEALLARLLGIVSGAIQISSNSVLSWDDVIITGQRFFLDSPPSTLLTMQAFGELLAAEDKRSFRLVNSGDDLLVKNKNEIRSQLNNLKASDLDLHFQPILQISNPGHFGLELLIRFHPPALKKVGTGNVIQMAHDIGIAHRIDALVISRLAEVQQALKGSEVLHRRIEYVSINISTDSVATDQRLNQLISLLKQHAIDSSIFYLEITEMAATNIVTGSEDVTTASERLMKELKFRIFIDDFGSGLSNYRRISEAWYDAIKLDIDLIKGIDRSFRLQRYVGSFIDTVHALGKTVVCEGVATHNELTAVVRLGADALQGFLVSPPLTLLEVESFIRTSAWADREGLQQTLDKIHASSKLRDSGKGEEFKTSDYKIPLERYIFDNWSRLRSFEEFVLLFVNELKSWGLNIHRFSLAFLPDQDDIDCSQYVWTNSRPGLVTTLRMERDFLEQDEHLHSPLHFIATRSKVFRQKLTSSMDFGFPFLGSLKQAGCSDYLGIRLDSRGISIPVLTIALHDGSAFSDEEVQRIEAMSSLLSLLFYAFESERSKRLAMLDPLTELANRRSFDSFLKSNISASRLTEASLSLALIDIDQFKLVNDELGHAYGDTCLKEIAEALKACLRRKSDFVARLGGEEFAIILPKTAAESSLNIGERLRQSILDKGIYHPGNETGHILTVSIGIAVWNPATKTDCDADKLLQLADDCLYEAKRNGRNRVVCRSLHNQMGLSS